MEEARKIKADWKASAARFVWRRSDGFDPIGAVIDLALKDAEVALRVGAGAMMIRAAERLGAEHARD